MSQLIWMGTGYDDAPETPENAANQGIKGDGKKPLRIMPAVMIYDQFIW